MNTTCGASNISFGLPNRVAINSAFLSMAIGAGLTSAITNPLEAEIMAAIRAADVLAGHDENCMRWLDANRAPARRGQGRRGGRRGKGAGIGR